MTVATLFNYNSNSIRFETREGLVWVCLTDMAKASKKLFADWNRLKSTNEYLTALEYDMGFPITETIQGGLPSKQGTWGIEEVAIEFAGWCSVHFKIWMNRQIKTLMSQGHVALPQTEQPQLLADPKAVHISESIKQIQDNLGDNNPRLVQFLIDTTVSEMMPASKSLTGSKLIGVVEIARSLGLPVDFHNRSKLGVFVKSKCGELSKLEKRLVNGVYINVHCYPEDNPVVIQAVKDYFN